MGTKVKINTNRLTNDISQIQSCITNISNEILNMKNSVSSLEQMWSGPGCKAFHKVFYDDMKAVETIVKNLQSILNYDRKAKKEYEKCDRKVAEMVGDINV